MNLHLQSLGNIVISAFLPKKLNQPAKYLTIIFLSLLGVIGTNNASAQPCFKAAITTGTAGGAGQPQYGAVGDFNKDGNLDYVVATSTAGFNSLSLFLGNGTGGFGTVTSLPVGTQPVTAIVADFNKDGILDIATDNSNGSSITILMGNGSGGVWNGTFTSFTHAVTSSQQALASADFNGDTYPDIIVPCNGTNGLNLFVNSGAGAAPTVDPFSAANELTEAANSTQIPLQGSSSLPRAIVVGDFNGDGKQDFAVTYQASSSNAEVYLNTSTAFPATLAQVKFAASSQGVFSDGGNQPLGMAAGDINGDGILDLVMANNSTVATGVSIWMGNGNGTFTAANPGTFASSASFAPSGIAIFDYNGDGIPDIVTANESSTGNTVSVFRGNGNGTFQAASAFTVGTNPYGVSVGDFNNDGLIDIVANNVNSANISVLLNSTTRSTQTISGNCLGSVVTGGTVRHNGNGVFHDVVSTLGCDKTITTTQTVNTVTTTQSVNLCAPSTITVGSATHRTTGTYTDITGVNGNGCNNITVTKLKVFFGSGATSFTAQPNLTTGFNGPQYGTTADFNKDGNMDYAVANSNAGGGITLYKGNGDGTFTPFTGSPFAVGNGPVTVIAADFNKDGIMDLAANNNSDKTVTVLMGNGSGGVWNGTFTSFTTGVFFNSQSLVAADFNGDGYPDIAVPGNPTATIDLFMNSGAGAAPTVNPFTSTPTSSVAMSLTAARQIIAADFNNDGNMDLAVSNQGTLNNVQVFMGNGTGGFTANLAFPSGASTNGALALTSADFNGDGNADLAVANTNTFNVGVLLGRGDGTFRTGVLYLSGTTAATGPSGIAYGDFNGDGVLDLATSNAGTSNTGTGVFILRGVGDGTFLAATSLTAGSGPYGLSVDDFNNDGKPDIIAPNYSSSNASVFLNTQTTNIGSLVTATATPTVCQNGTITLTGGTSGLTNYSWSGPNTFTSSSQSTTIPNVTVAAAGSYTLTGGIASGCSASTATAAVVVNSPAVATASVNTPVCKNTPINLSGGPSGQSSYLWSGPNSFTSSSATSSNSELGATTAAAGVYTLIVTAANTCTSSATTSAVTVNSPASTNQNISICSGQSITVGGTTHTTAGTYTDVTGTDGNGCNTTQVTNLKVLYGNSGATSFTASSGSPITTGTGPQYGTVADFDHDGNLDYAVANSNGSNSVSIFKGNGLGGFTAFPVSPQTVGTNPTTVISGDFNKDGIMDLASNSSNSGTATILMGNGSGGVWNGTFTSYTLTVTGATGSQNIISADFNNDGYPDIAVGAFSGTGNLSVFLNTGAGAGPTTNPFPATPSTATAMTGAGGGARGIVAADFNRDGNIDLAIGYQAGSSNLQIFLGNGFGGFIAKPVFNGGTVALIALATGDFNGDGIPDLAAQSSNAAMEIYQGVGDGTFTALAALAGLSTPQGVSFGDVNGDGIGDLVVANYAINGAGSISTFIGNGTGGAGVFTASTAFNGGAFPYSATLGDFNNDGKLDIAAGDIGSSSTGTTATILLNTSSSTLTATANAATPICANSTLGLTSSPTGATYSWTGPNGFTSTAQNPTIPNVSTAAAGIYTLSVSVSSGCSSSATTPTVVINSGTATASAGTPVCVTTPLNLTGGPAAQTSYLWKGPNGFTSAAQSPELGVTTATAGVYTLTVTATNGCTTLATTSAVAVNNPASTTVSFNRCAGQSVTVGSNTHMTTGTYTDVTGTDGNGCNTTQLTNLKVLYGNGGATSFSASTGSPITTGTGPQYGTVADFDHDGNLDYAVANSNGSNSVSIFKGNGLGGFTAFPVSPQTVGTNPTTVISGDFNKDGIMDLASNSSNSGTATILMGNGSGGVWNGTFTSYTLTVTGATGTQNIISADFNNDGYPDIAIGAFSGTGNLSVFLNTAAGAGPTTNPFPATPSTATAMTGAGGGARGIVAADFNRDGNIDLAIGYQAGSSNLQIFLGNGFGGFIAKPVFNGGTVALIALATGDFNGDGIPDLAAQSSNAAMEIYQGVGDGTFTALAALAGLSTPQGVSFGDVNGDGIGDLVVANYAINGAGSISTFIGNGTGGAGVFTASTAFNGGAFPYSATLGDFNNDGKLDIAAGDIGSSSTGTTATILLNTTAALSVTASAPASLCPGGTLNLTSAPTGTFGYSWTGPNTFTSSVQNPSIPNVTAAASGTYTVTVVVSSGCSASATTPNVTVNPVVATASANTPVCSNSALSLTGGPSSDTYVWTGPNGFSSTLQNPGISNPTVTNNGTYTLVVTATGGCTSVANTGAVSVLTGPAIRIQSVTRCAPNTFTEGGVVHTITGTYLDRVSGAAPNGCDSLVLTKLTVAFGSGATTFTVPAGSPFAGATGFQYGTTGFFNGDTKLDYAVANSATSVVSVYLGNGDGTLQTRVDYSVGAGAAPVAVVSGDFNGDGITDLATDNSGGGTAAGVSVLLGKGDGTFQTHIDFPITAAGTQFITAGDFNNDGKLDIAISNYGSSNGTTLTVLLNKGSGSPSFTLSFAAGADYSVGASNIGPRGVIATDFNNDGILDLATGNQTNGSASILIGNGDGTFKTPLVIATAAGALSITNGDFNGDGNMDIATGNQNGSTVTVLYGKGDGTFPTVTSAGNVGTGPVGIAAADFNGDGKMDLVTANNGTSQNGTTVSILLGNGNGTFQAATTSNVGTGPYSVLAADLNSDGKADIVAGNYQSGNVSVLLNAQASLASVNVNTPVCNGGTNNSTLTLTGPVGLSTYSWKGPNSFSSTLQIPTIPNPTTNAAGIYTLTVASSFGCTATATSAAVVVNNSPVTNQTINQCSSFVVGSTRHNTTGNYTDILTAHDGCDSTVHTNLTINAKTTTQSFTKCIGQTVTVGSHTYNESGTYIDHFSAHNGCDSAVTTNLTVFFGATGAPATVSNTATLSTGTGPQYGTTADFNGDGHLDYAVPNSLSNSVSLFLGNGLGGFAPAAGSPFAVGTAPVTVVSGDFNKDGIIDLATDNSGGSSATVLMGNGSGGVWNGTFTSYTLALPGGSQTLIATDINNDGFLDLAVPGNGGSDNNLSIFLNTTAAAGPGTSPFPLTPTSNVTMTNTSSPSNTARGIVAGDFNGDGNPDFAVCFQAGSNNMQIFLGNGVGGFTAQTPFTPAGSNGILDLVTADLNGDHILDLATANQASSTVSILNGNGSGGFTLSSTVGGLNSNTGISYVDFNGDGNGDLVLANSGIAGAGSISVLLGNGTGGFAATTALNGGNNPYVVTIGDFNGDGKPDIAASDFGTGSGNGTTATILINTTSLTSAVSANSPICSGNPLNLTAERSGLASYSWTGPNSFNSTIQNPSIANPTTAATGVYTLKVTDSHGCTSSASTPTVVVNATTSFTQTVTACGQLMVGSIIHTATGTYTDIIGSAHGCDSTVITHLTITPSTSITQSVEICAGQNVVVGTETHTGEGTYTDRITGGAHSTCDSVVTTNLKVLFGNGAASFSTSAPTSAGTGPSLGTSADFNGDSKTDYAVANFTSNTVSVFFGNGIGSFAGRIDNAVGTNPVQVISGDFNNDGKVDLATNNAGSNDETVLLGNGDGTFRPVGMFASGSHPQYGIVGDFNGDGKLDYASANDGANSVSVFINNGDGTFSKPHADFGVGAGPVMVISGDFNGDGILDLATDNSTAGAGTAISVLIGNGDGTFQNHVDFAASVGGTQGITSGDYNGDGKLDIAVSNYNASGGTTVSVLLNNGSGSPAFTLGFAGFTDYQTGSLGPRGIITGDFNKDGRPDLAVANQTGGNISVLINNAASPGTFYAGVNYPTAAGCLSITSGDFNRDGIIDLAGGNENSGTVSIYLGNGDGTFTAAVPSTITVGSGTTAGLTGLACADVNLDGKPDLITANNGTPTFSGNSVSVLLGNGSGGFATPVNYQVGLAPYGVSTGDFNGDGVPDIAAVNYNSSNVYVLPGKGDGTFISYQVGLVPEAITTADFNGDGIADLAVSNSGSNSESILIGYGNGTFKPKADNTVGTSPHQVITGDFNGDGKTDLAIADQAGATNDVSILLGNGNGSFQSVVNFTAGGNPIGITSSDFNGDGKQDLVVATQNTTVAYLQNNGSGSPSFTLSFAAATTLAAGTNTTGIGSIDYNGDGNADIAVADFGSNNVSVLMGNGSGGFQSHVDFTTGTGSSSITNADFNGDGKTDIAVDNFTSNNVSILLNTIATVPATATAASNSPVCPNGTLNLTGGTAGQVSYIWSGPNGFVDSTQSPTLIDPTTAGGGVYAITVTDSRGCSGTANTTVVLKPLPPIAVNPPSAVCTGLTVQALAATGASTYVWSPTSNLTPSLGTSATETAQISVLTFYTVTGTGTDGCTDNVVVPVATVATGGIISPNFSIICSGGTKALTVTGAAGHDYQWQISTDNINWTNITGATSTVYTTASGDGTTNKFYRLMAQSNSCWNVASTTAEVDVSIPNIIVSASNITDNSLILNWSPTGTGNYTISYSGPSSATLTSVTPAKTITGLTANGTYRITVTQTGVGCAASGTVTGVTTLCAMPTGVTLSSPASSQILVSWTGVVGADYRVYYRPLFSYNTYFTKDVSNVSSVLLTKQGNNNLYASTTYEVYVSRLDCPTTGAVGQGTSPTNVTTLPNVSCATPSIDSVRSLCPVQIEVFIHDNTVNQYNVYIQRITPSILAVNSYGVSGTYFTINTPYSGDQYLIAVEAKCGGALSNLYVWPGNVTIKPLCTSPNNLVLSNPTCHGFTASWNADQCLSNAASAYALYLRVAGTINYNSYGVPLPGNGIGPNKTINFVTSGRSYQVYVRSIYNCNGFVTYGPSSQVETITTLSGGCRDEDAQQPEETKPAVQQYSPDNQEVFSLYPNPNNGEFVVDLSRYSMEEDAVRIEVINMIGQTVITHLTTISGGHMNEFINLPTGTAAGTYIVRLTAGKNIYTAKINVSK